MNVLILGSGGREHALAWRLSQDEGVERVYVAPGNPGMAWDQNIQNIDYDGNWDELRSICSDILPELVVVGSEAPLVKGIVDELSQYNILVYGPNSKAARLEGSKIFSKKFMDKYSIPTAPYKVYASYAEAVEGLRDWDLAEGVAIKADVLAGGKGVVVSHSFDEARDALFNFMENPECTIKSERILIEKKLTGKELSWLALCDGKNFLPLGGVCDYKRVGDGNSGPNTGGMGCYTPKSWPGKELEARINEEVMLPVLKGMEQEGSPFQGTLFAGLMIDGNDINALEFNIRFGDPETQTLLPLLEGNLTKALIGCSQGNLGGETLTLSSKSSVHVVMASGGYPTVGRSSLDVGHAINWDPNENSDDAKIFFAGVNKGEEGLVNSGGRVLGVTALGSNVADARERAYRILAKISFQGNHWRKDIAGGAVG